MTYAIVTRESEARWRLFCNRCRKDLETINSEVLRHALLATVQRGGIMCPDCRRERCSRCGMKPERGYNDQGLCAFCEWETNDGLHAELAKSV